MMTHPENERRLFYKIVAALMTLLALTVGVAFVNLGVFNLPVAYAIAGLKAVLVVLFFMEVRHSTPTVKMLAAVGGIWLVLLLGGTLMDLFTR
jgi:cytochrome c oxidase subunit IV